MHMRPTKHLRPDTANRAQAVKMIVDGLSAAADDFAVNRADALEYCESQIAAPTSANGMSVAIGVAQAFFARVGLCIPGLIAGDAGARTELQRSITSLACGFDLYLHERRRQQLEADTPLSFGPEWLALLSLSLGHGDGPVADTVAGFLHGYFGAAGEESWLEESDLIAFYRVLIACHRTHRWEVPTALRNQLGPFSPLIDTVRAPGEFAVVLTEYCDFRLARAFQFADTRATKPRRPADPMYLFETQWYAIFPVELIALRAVCRASLGIELALESSHPLIMPTLLEVPPPVAPAEDVLSAGLQRCGAQMFGSSWRPAAGARTGTKN
jgi:hypothetical protein